METDAPGTYGKEKGRKKRKTKEEGQKGSKQERKEEEGGKRKEEGTHLDMSHADNVLLRSGTIMFGLGWEKILSKRS